MHYADIKTHDIANGPGVRVSVFVSGCRRHCPGCFNSEAWDFNYGKEFTVETENEVLAALEPSYIKGLSLLGGEPLEYENQKGLLPLLRKVKARFPEKDIWCYSGNSFDKEILPEILPNHPETKEFLSYLDILVDGEFVETEKNPSLRFRGSGNQRIIQVQKSLKANQVILWDLNTGL
ncbi:MAG: anaerobic ribonucleoside-triphosphate reductase activating protein [Bacillota bacterium]|jgi:anaerobic ribonucleoside-triphosphate reductase activating protein